ncbi:MAG TPA: cytochrome c3 family protein [Thermoanaerobaculia bacterium]|nr:cytochrome c3 family protein [Thermoanaerobaculia bacterium]
MRKSAAITIAFLYILAATVAFAAIPEKVTINVPNAKQPPVTLDHAKHATKLVKTCETCHHNHKGLTKDSKVAVEQCTSCHLDTKGNVMLSAREMSMTKNPFHVRCVGCHKTAKKGPVACTACHVKKG